VTVVSSSCARALCRAMETIPGGRRMERVLLGRQQQSGSIGARTAAAAAAAASTPYSGEHIRIRLGNGTTGSEILGGQKSSRFPAHRRVDKGSPSPTPSSLPGSSSMCSSDDEGGVFLDAQAHGESPRYGAPGPVCDCTLMTHQKPAVLGLNQRADSSSPRSDDHQAQVETRPRLCQVSALLPGLPCTIVCVPLSTTNAARCCCGVGRRGSYRPHIAHWPWAELHLLVWLASVLRSAWSALTI
jgi:hypothetical protein